MSTRGTNALAGSGTEDIACFLGSVAATGAESDEIARFLDPTEIAPLKSFFESLLPKEYSQVERLWRALLAIEERKRQGASALLEDMESAGKEDLPADAIHAIHSFAAVLRARAMESVGDGGNLYLGARPPGAQQRAFELLRFRTPLIPFAYAAGNRAALDFIGDAGDVTLIDVGIGRGGQIGTLLRNPATKRAIRRLHVVGVEPDEAALATAQLNIEKAAEAAGIPITFKPIAKVAERLTVQDLQAAELRGAVVAMSCLALHHMPVVDGGESRDAVLRILREAGAAAVVMVEPDSNHHTEDPLLAFLNAYRHYRSVAASVYSSLPPADAQTVFNEFFVPEVENVMGQQGARRSERHEESHQWCKRLEGAGWKVDALGELLPPAAASEGFDARVNGKAFSLWFRGVPLLSIIRARV